MMCAEVRQPSSRHSLSIASNTCATMASLYLLNVPSLTSGVHEGSILGPLQFMLYINNAFNIENPVQQIAYADDRTIFVNGPSVQPLITRTDTFLISFQYWPDTNHLKINVRKTKSVFFRSRKKATKNTPTLVTLIKILLVRLNRSECILICT